MRRGLGFVLAVGLGLGGLAGCGGGGGTSDASGCGKALDSYHAALVASDTDGSGPNLTDAQNGPYQNAVVKACDQAHFEALLSGPNYDYTKGPDAIAVGDPTQVYSAFCSGAPKPNAC